MRIEQIFLKISAWTAESETFRIISLSTHAFSHCLIPLMAQGALLRLYTDKKKKNGSEHFAAFCLFRVALHKNCALLGGNGNTLKLEMTTKLKDKHNSIATVRDLLRTFATFLAPLLCHYRLPLKDTQYWHTYSSHFPPSHHQLLVQIE